MADQITIICKRTVVGTKPVQPGKFHHLSVLDRVMEHNRIRMVYYYGTPPGRAVGALTNKLRETISEMLNGFPMVTGRLVKDDEGQWMIKCNDAGVRMVEARAKGSVYGWLRRVDREKELMLVHWEDMYYKPYFWSTFYVQLTEFEEGGLAIGLSCTHLLADPPSATFFIKSWANMCKTDIPPPFSLPQQLRKPTNKSPIQNPAPDMTKHHTMTTITFGFTDEMVQSCISMAKAPGAPDFGSSLTPFEALAGLFWVCISKSKGQGYSSTLTKMSVCLDMRETLGLDKGFFGNSMGYRKVRELGYSEDRNGLSKAAFAIGEVVKKMTNNEGIIDFESNPITQITGGDLICAKLDGVESNSTRFEDDFDLIRVSCYIEPVIGEGQVLILPSVAEDGGFSRVAMVTLAEDEAVKLCEDGLLLQFNPNILMGASRS